MSKRPKYRAEDFPEPGSVIEAPLADGRRCAGLVLRREFHGGAQGVLVAVSSWIGRESPPLDSPELHRTLILTHHSWNDHPERFWTWELLPATFVNLGTIELSREELATTCDAATGWHSMPHQVLTQWRWDHDREALLREEAQQAAELAESHRQQAARRAAMMNALTLDLLATRNWFESWRDRRDAIPVDKCRALLHALVLELQAAPKRTASVVKKCLQQSVEAFNDLDAARPFIQTIEREEIIEAYEQILCAAKHPLLVDQVERWRNW